MAASAPAEQNDHNQAANPRSRRKSDRRVQLLSAAERLFAERGFLAVRLEDIGAAAGVSGPAIYRHFPNKESLLVELLVGISTRLLAGAREVRSRGTDAAAALTAPIRRGLGGRTARTRARACRDRRPPDGARRVRSAQLHAAQPEACRRQGSAVACGDAGDDCGRLDRRRFAVVAHLLNPAIK